MSEIGVGILGFGTVGAGVADGLLKHRSVMAARLGVDIELKKIADLDITTDRGVAVPSGVLSRQRTSPCSVYSSCSSSSTRNSDRPPATHTSPFRGSTSKLLCGKPVPIRVSDTFVAMICSVCLSNR